MIHLIVTYPLQVAMIVLSLAVLGALFAGAWAIRN